MPTGDVQSVLPLVIVSVCLALLVYIAGECWNRRRRR